MSSPEPTDVRGDPSREKERIEAILAEAKRQGASTAEAAIGLGLGLSVTVRLGAVETIEHVRDRRLGVTVFFGKKTGSASTTDFSQDAIRKTVQAACAIARHTALDESAGLADPERMATHVPDLDLYHPWNVTPEAAIALALTAENAARGIEPTFEGRERITNSHGATVNWHEGARIYGNTHGFLGAYTGTQHSISCSVIAGQGDGMQRGSWYTTDRDPTALWAPRTIGEEAARRAIARLDPKRIPTGKVPVVFRADVAGSLMGLFIAAIHGGNLYRRSSFLLEHLGKRVFPDFVRIHEQPLLPKALGSIPFDSEGVAVAPRKIVTDGILQGYVLDSYSARKLGMETTGNAGGVHNLIVEPGDKDLSGLLREMDKGLLITELMGHGINLVTGDYSQGASGFWIEGGDIAHPVQEITIAGNLEEMFLGISGIGCDTEMRGNVRVGSVMMEHMTVAGV